MENKVLIVVTRMVSDRNELKELNCKNLSNPIVKKNNILIDGEMLCKDDKDDKDTAKAMVKLHKVLENLEICSKSESFILFYHHLMSENDFEIDYFKENKKEVRYKRFSTTDLVNQRYCKMQKFYEVMLKEGEEGEELALRRQELLKAYFPQEEEKKN